jgi:conjugal transfer pilus assembly protein TraD
MMRVKSKVTAEILTNQLEEVKLMTSVQASAVTDNSDDRDVLSFSTRNEDRVSSTDAPMLTPADLVKLPKGQAFALIEGGQIYKIRLPLFDPTEKFDIPTDLENIANSMKNQYNASLDLDEDLVQEGKGSGF